MELRAEIRNGININVKLLTSMAIQQEAIRSRRNLRSTDKVNEDDKYSKHNDNDSNKDDDEEEEEEAEEEEQEATRGEANNNNNDMSNNDQVSTSSADVDMMDQQEQSVDNTSSHSMIVDSYNDDDNTPPATTALFQVDSPIYSEDVVDELEASILPIKQVVMSSLESNFDSGPPFTIQRLAELILRPTEHYSEPDKYLRAIQRLVTVTSTPSDYPSLSSENGISTSDEYSISIGLTTISSASSSDTETGSPPDMTIHTLHDEDITNNDSSNSSSNDSSSPSVTEVETNNTA
ncbi:hypothetical protein BDF22DRAFT_693354 [Syncephalis plumigaleata]|nr:hypothetical protein BDF22DRAFT_693354 [Syncephalis plumigaleata]